VPSYPGGLRPSATVVLAGGGARGHGEHVGWTDAAHASLRSTLGALVPRGRTRVGDLAAALAARTADPYHRAALEAAAVDLACRQAGTNLFRLADAVPTPVRYVLSFDRRIDPVSEARRLLAATPGLRLKLDVDGAWDDAVWAGLAATGAVDVLDWKGTGAVAEHERAHRFLPAALLEDPRPGAWSAGVRARLALDAAIGSAADLGRLPVRPAAVNLKPARLGGVLETLATAAACAAAGIAVYVGGMWEVGVGRAQLHVLAALLSPNGPNDVAPIAIGDAAPARPPRLAVDGDAPGYGARRGGT
jgi:L-alanine-DL-glutamate epimerase-like enolase superfamily enzyme